MKWIALLLTYSSALADNGSTRLYFGFVTKIRCEGRLLVSAVGNDGIVRLEALPREIGCGVLLKPLVKSGETNLFLETSVGTIRRMIIIRGGNATSASLQVDLRAEEASQ